MVEVVLVYRPGGSGSEVECRIATSRDADAARTVARAVIREAQQTADEWRGLDPKIGAMRQADADRLSAILRQVVPDYDNTPGRSRLRLMRPPDSGADR